MNLLNFKALTLICLMVFFGGGKTLASKISKNDVSFANETSLGYATTSETSVSLTDDSQSGITISPVDTIFRKAPITITITAPENALFVTYTTSELDVPIQQYTGPFQVTKSGTSVKATAFTANGQANAVATYTIVPDQPLFSEESKAFSEAFSVTLSLPGTTDATSTIHYAIGEKATAESAVYEGPVTISASNIGDEVVLHAVVVDVYGNVGEEKTCTYTFDKPASLSFKAHDTAGYYATFSANHDVVFPTSVVAYAVSVENGKSVMTALSTGSYEVYDGQGAGITVEGYYVPANTGVLVMSQTTETPYYFVKTAQTTTLPANYLKPSVNGGVFEAEDGYLYYKLAYGNNAAKTDLGFYWGADNGGAFSVKAGTAYLAVPSADVQNAKPFVFNSETTGINRTAADSKQHKAVYNMNGQRVESMQQTGLYVVDGKKVIIRK